MSAIDFFLISKIAKERHLVVSQIHEEPYKPELNKKLPSTISKDDLVSKNVMDFPEVPEVLKPVVDGFIGDLKRLEVIKKNLADQQAELQSLLAEQKKEINDLQIKINEQAQEIGSIIQNIDPEVDQVIARVKDMFIAAQRTHQTVQTQTMDSEAQLEVLKNIMIQVNSEFAQDVLAQWEIATQKFITVNEVVKKALRVWPIPQNRMKNSVKILMAQAEDGILEELNQLKEMLHHGLNNLVQLHHTIDMGIKEVQTPKSNVTKMPQMHSAPFGLAAQKHGRY